MSCLTPLHFDRYITFDGKELPMYEGNQTYLTDCGRFVVRRGNYGEKSTRWCVTHNIDQPHWIRWCKWLISVGFLNPGESVNETFKTRREALGQLECALGADGLVDIVDPLTALPQFAW